MLNLEQDNTDIGVEADLLIVAETRVVVIDHELTMIEFFERAFDVPINRKGEHAAINPEGQDMPPTTMFLLDAMIDESWYRKILGGRLRKGEIDAKTMKGEIEKVRM